MGSVVEHYVLMYGGEPWPQGITTLQLYAPVDLALNISPRAPLEAAPSPRPLTTTSHIANLPELADQRCVTTRSCIRTLLV